MSSLEALQVARKFAKAGYISAAAHIMRQYHWSLEAALFWLLRIASRDH